MNDIETKVLRMQQDDLAQFAELYEQFKPLIITWLRKIHKLHTTEAEDYMSMAKIILLECVRSFDAKRNVPFASYYKIKLYHWYGNQMQKREVQCSYLNEAIIEGECVDLLENITRKENVQHLAACIGILNRQEQDILRDLMDGKTALEIGRSLNLSKKTILNKKYIIIKKMKVAVAERLGNAI